MDCNSSSCKENILCIFTYGIVSKLSNKMLKQNAKMQAVQLVVPRQINEEMSAKKNKWW